MNRYDDEHFKNWPFSVSDAEIHTEGYLKSLTSSEELAVFLSLRGNCLKAAGRLNEAADCYAKASHLAPSWNAYRALLADLGKSQTVTSGPMEQTLMPQNIPLGMDIHPVGVADPNPLKNIQ